MSLFLNFGRIFATISSNTGSYLASRDLGIKREINKTGFLISTKRTTTLGSTVSNT
jgi:hypothetical protein